MDATFRSPSLQELPCFLFGYLYLLPDLGSTIWTPPPFVNPKLSVLVWLGERIEAISTKAAIPLGDKS